MSQSFDAHGKSTGYCAGDPLPEFMSDRSGACDPHGCATTAEIEFLGEPLMTLAVHTTYTKFWFGASQNRLTCSCLNNT